MKCPFCIEEGEKSRLTDHGGTVTLMGWWPFYDEDGVYHQHDPNWRTNEYSCSRGHRYVRSVRPNCPVEGCDYGGEERHPPRLLGETK